MTVKQRIHAAVDSLPEEKLDEVYRLISTFACPMESTSEPGIMAKLKNVRINAPADFARNLDLYANGEKKIDAHLP